MQGWDYEGHIILIKGGGTNEQHRPNVFVRLPIDSGRELSDAEEVPLGGRKKWKGRGVDETGMFKIIIRSVKA